MQRDVIEGKVSPEAARDDYGVVLVGSDDDCTLDEAATDDAARRDEGAAHRTAADDRSRAGLPEHARPETVTDGDALYRRAHHAQRGRRGCSPAGRCSWTTCSCRGCCTPRSCAATHAHARLLRRRRRGGARRDRAWSAVYTAADLGDYWQPGPLLVPPPPIEGIVFNQRTQVPLAKDKVRHVGEPIAMVVAESRYLAEDAARRHRRRLRAAAGGRRSRGGARAGRAAGARGPGSQRRRPRASSARATTPRRAQRADRVIRAPLPLRPRRLGADREPRRGGAVGRAGRPADGLGHDPGARSPSATAWRRCSACSSAQVRVIAPFIGGGFGPKIMMFYPEEVLVPWAAMRLDRPVKWIEDRLRELLRHHAGARPDPRRRDRARRATAASSASSDVFLHDTGAYDPYGLTVPINSQCTLLGPYDVPNYDSEFTAVFTNKTIVTPVPRRRPAARRVRDRAAARHRGARARARPRRDPAPQPHPARRVPLRQRDHLPGLRAARLRQRQLRAGARQGAAS